MNVNSRSLVLVLFAWSLLPAQALQETFSVAPYVQALSDSGARIAWQWKHSRPAFLLYSRDTKDWDTLPGAADRFARVNIQGLVPGARYFYTIVAQKQPLLPRPSQYWFHTAPLDHRETVIFAAIGDTRSGEESFHADHRRVVESIRTVTSPQFLCHLGDMVDITEPGSWEMFHSIEHPLLRQCVLFPIRGNSDGDAESFSQRFSLPTGACWYSVSYGPVFLIALDLQHKKPTGYYKRSIGPSSEQYQWLEAQLRSNRHRNHAFTIVMAYAPLFAPDGSASQYCQQTLVPLFEHYEVDLVLHAGMHCFSTTHHNGIMYVISGGGGAALEQPGPASEAKRFRTYRIFHHLRLTVHYPVLRIEAIDPGGTIFYSFDLRHRARSREHEHNDTVLSVALYGTSTCESCVMVKNTIIPSCLKQIQPQQVSFRFFDITREKNLNDYMSLEKRLGNRDHSFPVVVVGNTLYSGSQLNLDTLCAAIRAYAAKKTIPSDHSPLPSISLFYLLVGGTVLVLLGAMLIIFRSKK